MKQYVREKSLDLSFWDVITMMYLEQIHLFRETSNIKDGSNIMADMATQCFAGNAARGMTMIALHNGGGVGIGKSINGGFGMVLDGSKRVDDILWQAMPWGCNGWSCKKSLGKKSTFN